MELSDIIARATETAAAAEAKRLQEQEEAEQARVAKLERKAKEKERIAARKEKEKDRAKRKENGHSSTSASASGGFKPPSSAASIAPSASTSSAVDKMADKDKRLLKLVGEVVVKHMSRYRDQLDREVFKKTAKDVGLPFFPPPHRILNSRGHSSLISLLRKRKSLPVTKTAA